MRELKSMVWTILASLCAGVIIAIPAHAGLVKAIEYAGDHIFLTAHPAEIEALDSGATPGWKRTGVELWVQDSPALDRVPVCRFYSTAFAPRGSHFYTADAAECAAVRSNTDWVDEGIAFYVQLPDQHGDCPLHSAPIYRHYNNGRGGVPSHKFTPYDQSLENAGWTRESASGIGGASFCTHWSPTELFDLDKPGRTQMDLLEGTEWELNVEVGAGVPRGFKASLRFPESHDNSRRAEGFGHEIDHLRGVYESAFALDQYGAYGGFAGWHKHFGVIYVEIHGEMAMVLTVSGLDTLVGAWCPVDVRASAIGFGGYVFGPCLPVTGHRKQT